MVEMVMRHHEVSDWLVRHELLDFREERNGPLSAQRRLDQHDVVFELNERAVMRPTRQIPHPFGELLRFNAHGGRACLTHGGRCFDCGRSVRLDRRYADVERWESALFLHYPGRELDPA